MVVVVLREIRNARFVRLMPPKRGWLATLINGEQQPYVDFVVGKKYFGLTVPPGGPRASIAAWEGWAAAQSSTPVCFMKTSDDNRYYWWFEDKFYWEPDGLSPSDVLALVREKERRTLRQLERARTAMTFDARSDYRRGIPTRGMRVAVFERDGGRCAVCGSTFDLQYDHILPVALGGATTVDNLQLLCAECNQRKGSSL